MNKKYIGYIISITGLLNITLLYRIERNVIPFLTFLVATIYGIYLLSKEDTPIKTLFDKLKNYKSNMGKSNVSASKETNIVGSSNKKGFPIPLWAGWGVNILGWVLFVSTMDNVLEIITALLCIGCVYVAYKHKQAGTTPFLGMERLSANNLIYSSAFEAIWMLAWGLDFFGDFNF